MKSLSIEGVCRLPVVRGAQANRLFTSPMRQDDAVRFGAQSHEASSRSSGGFKGWRRALAVTAMGLTLGGGAYLTTQMNRGNPPVVQESEDVVLQKKVIDTLLESEKLPDHVMALNKLVTGPKMTDAYKVQVIERFLAQTDPELLEKRAREQAEQAQRPGADARPMFPGGDPKAMETMMMEMQARQFMPKMLVQAVSAIEDDMTKLSLLRDTLQPKGRLNDLDEGLDTVLQSFSKQAPGNREFQTAVNNWLKPLAKEGDTRTKGLVARVLAVQKDGQLLVTTPATRFRLYETLMQDPEVTVKGMAAESLAQSLPHDPAVDAEKHALIAMVMTGLKDIPAAANDEITLYKTRGAYHSLVRSVAGLKSDSLKVSTLDRLMLLVLPTAGSDTVDALTTALKAFQNAGSRNAYMDRMRASTESKPHITGTLTIARFPEHPKFSEAVTELCKSDNLSLLKVGSFHLPEISDPAIRKRLLEDTMTLQDTRLREVITAYKPMEAELDKIGELLEDEKSANGGPLGDAEKRALEARMNEISPKHEALEYKQVQITQGVEYVAAALPTFNDDPALQRKWYTWLLESPFGKLRYYGAKRIGDIQDETLKADLIAKATDPEGNRKFYDPTYQAKPGEGPFLHRGQTPFESITAQATLALDTLTRPEIKYPLIQKLAAHPHATVRLRTIIALGGVKSEHAGFTDTIIELTKTRLPAALDTLVNSLKGYPAPALAEIVDKLAVQGLDKPKDDYEGSEIPSRMLAMKLLPLLPAAYDAKKFALVKAGVADRHPAVRMMSYEAGFPIHDPALRGELIVYYATLKGQGPEHFNFNVRGLQALGDAGVPQAARDQILNDMTVHPELGIRAEAVRKLYLHSDPVKRNEMAWAAAKDKEMGVKIALVDALTRFPKEDSLVETLFDTLSKSPDEAVVVAVANAMGTRPVDALLDTLSRHEKPGVRVAAGIAAMRHPSLAFRNRILPRLLEDRDPDVRSKLAWQLSAGGQK